MGEIPKILMKMHIAIVSDFSCALVEKIELAIAL